MHVDVIFFEDIDFLGPFKVVVTDLKPLNVPIEECPVVCTDAISPSAFINSVNCNKIFLKS